MDRDIDIMLALMWVGLIVTAPLWGPVAAVAWLWDRLRGA